jgi:Bifunctional DNA primase/polymerase, N-terminal
MNTFESNRNPIQVAALRYAHLSLTPIPLRPNQKTACHRRWPTLRPRTLLQRFQNHHGNIGLRMGRQPNGTTLVAVDIDTKNGGTLETLTQNRCWPTVTACAITPSGGTHFLLRLPEDQLVRTRIGLIKGVDLIGEGGLIVVEPSAIGGMEYVWVNHPAQGIAPAPTWLLTDLRRGGLVGRTGPKKSCLGGTSQNSRGQPQATRRGKKGHRQPIRKAKGPEPGLLPEALSRFPVPGPGSRHNQLIRLICAFVCDPREFSDVTIRDTALDWWRHWYDLRLCRTPPDAPAVDIEIRRTRRSHSRGKIITDNVLRYARLRAFLRRPLPFLPYGGLAGQEAPAAKPARLGSAEANFVATLLVHFTGEALLSHPLDDSYKATNKQLIEKMKWVHGTVIGGRELRDLKRKFISRPGKPATKLEIMVCVREGFRTGSLRVPSYYQLTPIFVQLWEQFAQTGS